MPAINMNTRHEATKMLRKEKLKRLAQREEGLGRKKKMEQALSQRISTKLNLYFKRKVPKSSITKAVNGLVDCGKITNNNLDSVAEWIVKDITNSTVAQVNETPKHKKTDNVSLATIKMSKPEKNGNYESAKVIKSKIDKTNPWLLIEAFKVVETEDTLESEQEKAFSNRRDMASMLQKQISEKQKVKDKLKKEDQRFVDLQCKELEMWKQKVQEADTIESKKEQQLQKMHQEQIDALKHFRQKESGEARRVELAEISNCQRELQLEEEKKRLKKEQEHQHFERIMAENVENDERLQQKQIDEAEMDIKYMAQYKARLDLEEARRAQEFSMRVKRFEAFGHLMSNSDVMKSKKENDLKLERKILREAKAKEKADIEREKRDLEKLNQDRNLINETNKRMAEEKRIHDIALEKAEQALSIQCLKQNEAVLAREKAKLLRKKDDEKFYSGLLEEQTKEQKRQQGDLHDNMTSTEKAMNRKVLEKIKHDSKLQQKIVERLSVMGSKLPRGVHL